MRAIVFDCDGVLVDSEPASVTSWVTTLGAVGLAVSPAEIEAWVGNTDRAIAEHYAPRCGLSVEDVLGRARHELGMIMEGQGIPTYDDAMQLLSEAMRRGLGIAVGTNSSRDRLDSVLRAAGLEHLIPLSVAADEVAAPKPAPDVYRAAIDGLGVAAADTVVVEDTPTGIAAGLAAGCRVVAVDRGMSGVGPLRSAHLVVTTLA